MVRRKPLHGIFTAIPRRYDLVNHVITWGQDARWRRRAAKGCLAGSPRRVLDLCCGTGDLTLSLAQLAAGDVEITGIDYSRPMLGRATVKMARAGVDGKVSLLHGDVAGLPFSDGYFDSAGISFAFRNLTYQNPLAESYLAEILRVLAPGGRFVIIESSQPRCALVRRLFHLYLKCFVAVAGWLLTGNRGAYRYLAESASRYYGPGEVRELLLAAGFSEVAYRPLMWGAAGIYTAVK
jgi:demethylmenaquinone methyltransferase/2-methoxy-6-polyprenyl-1,4-benzoquinol methylase